MLDHFRQAIDFYLRDALATFPLPSLTGDSLPMRFDYSGKATARALPLRLGEIAPGLPEPGVAARLRAEDFVSPEVLSWLVDPTRVLLPEDQWPDEVPQAKVHVDDVSHWHEVAAHLYRLGILGPIAEDEIFTVRGKKVLSGAFAVEKRGEPGEGEVRQCRFIMNMIPANSFISVFTGDCDTLAPSTSWTALHVPRGCAVIWSGDDQKGAFHVWRLPASWRPLMTLGLPVPARCLGLGGDEDVWLCSQVIPMGWNLAVCVFQHLHRRLALRAPPLGAGLDPGCEWRGDQPKPLSAAAGHTWFQVYVDDFDAPEVVALAEVDGRQGVAGSLQLAMRASYAAAGVEFSEGKANLGAPVVERMGALMDGVVGRVSMPPAKLLEAQLLALQVASRGFVTWEAMLAVLGRLTRAFEFRRPLMGLLNQVYRFATWTSGGFMNMEMTIEVVQAIAAGPLAYTNLRATLSGLATVSDASERGGGVCASTGVTEATRETLRSAGGALALGRDGVMALAGLCSPAPGGPQLLSGRAVTPPLRRRLLLVSVGDGLCRSGVAACRLGLPVCAIVALDDDAASRRATRLRWPGVIDWGTPSRVTLDMVRDLSRSFGSLTGCVLVHWQMCGAESVDRAGRAQPLVDEYEATLKMLELLRGHFGCEVRVVATLGGGQACRDPRQAGLHLAWRVTTRCQGQVHSERVWCSWRARPRQPFAVSEASSELQNVCTRAVVPDRTALSKPQLVEFEFGFPLDYSSVASKGPSSSEGSATRLRVPRRCGAVSGVLAAVLDGAAV